MHMADALLSAEVGGTMCAVSALSVGYAVSRVKKSELSEKKIPIMAVSGAFVFAAQMINFTIPGTGSSGHIGGGILLAAMLGGSPALLTIASVLIIQCLFFADGGLLALGCNIFNMGVIPCLLVYPLLFKPVAKNMSAAAIGTAAVVSAVLGLQLGAFGVVLETQASGITVLPFGVFAPLMQFIHLAIGIVEGIITAAILCFVHKMRPEILTEAASLLPHRKSVADRKSASVRTVVVVFAVLSVIVGGVLSVFASTHPDGLEWAVAKTAGTAELPAEVVLQVPAVMPDYDYKPAEADGGGTSVGSRTSAGGTAVAGIVGGALVFTLAGGTGLLISVVKKSKNRKAESVSELK